MKLPNLICRFVACSVLAAIGALPTSAQLSPVGTIEGRIVNANGGYYLGGARVAVAGTNLETLTSPIGEYRLVNVPAGRVNVTASFVGYESQTKQVVVAPGEVVRQSYELSLSPLGADGDRKVTKLEAFTVTARSLSAQAAALNDQKNSANIKNVVTFDQFGDFGESNPAEYLKYVPGITIGFDPAGASTVVVRGMPTNGTVVMIDGAPAISASGDRSFNFQRTPSNNVASIEVNKSPTPDIPANAVGGSINVIKKTGFSRATPLATVNVFALFNALGKNPNVDSLLHQRVGSRFTYRPTQPGIDLAYLLPLNKSFAVTFNAGANRRYYDVDTIQSIWNLVTNVNERPIKTDVINVWDRKYASAQVDWKVGRYDTLTATAQVTGLRLQQSTAGIDIRFGASATGATGGADFAQSAPGGGVVAQAYNGNTAELPSQNFALRYLHEGPTWQAAVDWGYSHVVSDSHDLKYGFFRTITNTVTGLTLRGDGLTRFNDGLLPKLTATNAQGAVVNAYDGGLVSITAADSQPQKYTDTSRNISASLARDLPLSFPLRVKMGAAENRRTIDRTIDLTAWTFSPPGGAAGRVASNYDLIATDFAAGSTWRDYTGQKIAWNFVSPVKMYQLFAAHPEYFVRGDAAAYSSSVNNSKLITETITAGYLRADAKFFQNRLGVITGVRYEETADLGLGPLNNPGAIYQRDAAGNIVRTAAGAPVLISTDALVRNQAQFTRRGAKTDKKYHDYHPSLNSRFNLTENLLARASFARTIGRPSMNEIIPGVVLPDPTVATSNPTISVINTGLKPWMSTNYDVSLEAYQFKGAVASVGVFEKNISNFFASTTAAATPALLDEFGISHDYLGYNVVTKRNSGDARIRGLELSWQQKLLFLPEWAKGFDVYGNATYLRVTGQRIADFTGYRSRTVNLGLGYTRARLQVKLNATLGTKIPMGTVAQSASIPAGSVTYIDPSTVVDASLEYRLTKDLGLSGSARNLTQSNIKTVIAGPATPDYAKFRTVQRFGTLFTIGLKYQR